MGAVDRRRPGRRARASAWVRAPVEQPTSRARPKRWWGRRVRRRSRLRRSYHRESTPQGSTARWWSWSRLSSTQSRPGVITNHSWSPRKWASTSSVSTASSPTSDDRSATWEVCASTARCFADSAERDSANGRRCRARGSSRWAQCQNQIGNSHSSASVRRAAAAAHRPRAAWSGCPSSDQVVTSRVPRPSPTISTRRGGELVDVVAEATVGEPEPMHLRRQQGGAEDVHGGLATRRGDARPSPRAVWVGESGWLPFAVGGADEDDRDLGVAGGRDQAAGSQRLVVGVGTHHDHAVGAERSLAAER